MSCCCSRPSWFYITCKHTHIHTHTCTHMGSHADHAPTLGKHIIQPKSMRKINPRSILCWPVRRPTGHRPPSQPAQCISFLLTILFYYIIIINTANYSMREPATAATACSVRYLLIKPFPFRALIPQKNT